MSRWNFALLAAGAFVVALGYGVVLPIMPLLVERIAGVSGPAEVAWHTGALTSTYMFAVFLGAPLWGALSDRIGRRAVLMAGLLGCVVMLAAFAFSTSVQIGAAIGVLVAAGSLGQAVGSAAGGCAGGAHESFQRARVATPFGTEPWNVSTICSAPPTWRAAWSPTTASARRSGWPPSRSHASHRC